MVCDICGAERPEINIQQVIGQKKRSIHLCRKCANAEGIIKNNDTLEISLSKLVSFYLDIENKKKNPVCPHCGKTLQEIRKTQKIGCEECVIQFGKYVSKALGIGSSHGAHVQYSGNIPARMKMVKDVLVDLEILKKQLKTAINDEDYEKAALIRDRISNISPGDQQ